METKYFILILLCGHLNNTFFTETEASTTEKQMSHVSAKSLNTTGNPLGQPTQLNISSGQPISLAQVSIEQTTPAAYASSGRPAVHTSVGQTPAYNITNQPTPMANTPHQPTVLPVFTSARQLSSPPDTVISRQVPTPSAYNSTQQTSSYVHTPSRKPIAPTVHNPSTQPVSTTKNSPKITPDFIFETTSKTPPSHKNSNSIAAILIGIFLTLMLVAIIIIVLWKCLRKPVLNDQNWAGRSPFADGETPDMCMDNIRENEVPTKRMSIVSLMTWKPGKSTLSADDLEIKLFESSENIGESDNPKTEKIKDQVNGTSEDSADGSTIGTAVSSDDADLPPPPPLLDLEGQENNQSDDKPTMVTVPPLSNDPTSLQPSLDHLSEACEDQKPELQQSFPPPPDSPNLPMLPDAFVKNQDDSNHEIQSQEFSVPFDSDQDLNESLPPPPAELL